MTPERTDPMVQGLRLGGLACGLALEIARVDLLPGVTRLVGEAAELSASPAPALYWRRWPTAASRRSISSAPPRGWDARSPRPHNFLWRQWHGLANALLESDWPRRQADGRLRPDTAEQDNTGTATQSAMTARKPHRWPWRARQRRRDPDPAEFARRVCRNAEQRVMMGDGVA